MATVTLKRVGTITARVEALERDMRAIRTFVTASAARVDPEGEYRPEFVREMLKAAREKPTHTFKDPESFLASVRSFRHDTNHIRRRV
jgi:hypothetical protein